jgi:formylglycine-generating enzyme
MIAAAVAACGYPEPPPLGGDAAQNGDAAIDGPPDGSRPPAGPSCADLPATCGPARDADCCAVAQVPDGSFYRNYDAATDAFNDMGYPATVSSVWLDTYEVTVGRFRKFVEAERGTRRNPPTATAGGRTLNATANQGGWETGWNEALTADPASLVEALNSCNALYQTWTDTPGGNEDRPINCITWYEAFAFCVWDGGFLPTDAEWQNAAAGGAEQRAYPWSDPPSSTTIDCTHANSFDCVGAPDLVGRASPVGDGPWDHADLAGNLGEWVLDWHASTYPVATCDDCANLTPGTTRAQRGGSFRDPDTYVRVASRLMGAPAGRGSTVGVRCARVAR